jgi:hypothetical protein
MLSNSAQNSFDWANAAIEGHKQESGISGPDDVQAWHLILSLLTFCEVKGFDFDEILADARQHHAQET